MPKAKLTAEDPASSAEIQQAGKQLSYVESIVKTKFNLGDHVYYIVRRGEEFAGRNYINDGTVVGVKVIFRIVGKKAVVEEEKYEIHNENMHSFNLNIFAHNLFLSPEALCDNLMKKGEELHNSVEWKVNHVEPGTSYVTYDTNHEFGPTGLRTHIVDRIYAHALKDANGVTRMHVKYVTGGKSHMHEYELSWTLEEWVNRNYRKYEN